MIWDVLTHMHLRTAKQMPKKTHPVLVGIRAEKYKRQARLHRRLIAKYYRMVRQGRLDGHDASHARIAHRYGVVITAREAKVRIKHMEEVPKQ